MSERQPIFFILAIASLLVIGVMMVVVPMLNRDAERAGAQQAIINATVSGWLTKMAGELQPEATLTRVYAEARRLVSMEIYNLATATAVQEGIQSAKLATQQAYLNQKARETAIVGTPSAAARMTQTAEHDQGVLATLAVVGTASAGREAANVATLAALATANANREAALNGALMIAPSSAPDLAQITAFSDVGPVEQLKYSPDGAVFATVSEQTVTLWQSATATRMARYEHNTRVNDITFSPDGGLLAVATDDGAVWLWNATSDATLKAQARAILRGHKEATFQVVFNPDGGMLASAGADQTVIWDVETGRMLAALPSGWAWSVAFSPGGRYITTAGGDGTIRIWAVPVR
jgi:hypothetical protein